MAATASRRLASRVSATGRAAQPATDRGTRPDNAELSIQITSGDPLRSAAADRTAVEISVERRGYYPRRSIHAETVILDESVERDPP